MPKPLNRGKSLDNLPNQSQIDFTEIHSCKEKYYISTLCQLKSELCFENKSKAACCFRRKARKKVAFGWIRTFANAFSHNHVVFSWSLRIVVSHASSPFVQQYFVRPNKDSSFGTTREITNTFHRTIIFAWKIRYEKSLQFHFCGRLMMNRKYTTFWKEVAL